MTLIVSMPPRRRFKTSFEKKSEFLKKLNFLKKFRTKQRSPFALVIGLKNNSFFKIKYFQHFSKTIRHFYLVVSWPLEEFLRHFLRKTRKKIFFFFCKKFRTFFFFIDFSRPKSSIFNISQKLFDIFF